MSVQLHLSFLDASDTSYELTLANSTSTVTLMTEHSEVPLSATAVGYVVAGPITLVGSPADSVFAIAWSAMTEEA